MPSNNKYYTENQTIPNQLEYPILGAAGGSARRRENTSFYRPGESSIEELLNTTTMSGNAGIGNIADNQPVSPVIDPDQQNQILGIPSFLSYPSDLGKNRRFHHFLVFNIYQGTSDTVRLQSRKANQVRSALLAKGGFQFASENAGGNGPSAKQNEIIQTLKDAGYSQQQAEEYGKAIFTRDFLGTTGGLGAIGLASDENIGAIDNISQGSYSNADGVTDPDMRKAIQLAGGPAFPTVMLGARLIQTGADSYRSIEDYLKSMTEATNRDDLADANKNPKNFNQRGASGRYVNRPKEEQNILLANRRFNNANVKSKDTICLYMPQKITMNDQLIYSEEDMGTSKMLLDALTGKRGAASALVEKIGRRGISDAVGKIGEMANNVAVVGGALNEVAQETNTAAIRAAATRTVANPRKEMMFRDVGVRTHSFTFDFMPKNAQEAETALNIIRMLRYHAYPGLQGGGGHFFTFPAEFELTFYTIEDTSGMVVVNDNLPKMPRLALQSINVDFSAAGDFKTFTDAKPAFIRLELGFQEMEQLTNEHIVHGY